MDGVLLAADLILLVFALRTPWGLAGVFLVVRLTASAVWLLSRNLTDIGYVFVVAELTGRDRVRRHRDSSRRREIGEVREQRRKRRFRGRSGRLVESGAARVSTGAGGNDSSGGANW